LRTALILIKSPLQVLNAWEAIKSFNINDYRVYVRYGSNELSNLQIKSLVDFLHLSNVKYFLPKKYALGMFNELVVVRELKKKKSSFDYIMIGDYRATNFLYFLSNVKHKYSLLLDDGTASYYIQEKYLMLGKVFKNGLLIDFSRFLLAGFILNLKFDKIYKLDLFTSLNIDKIKDQKVFYNTYAATLDLLQSRNCRVNADLVFIIGAKYSEAGWMKQKSYFLGLDKLKNIYINKRIYYLPHRGEFKKKLDEIKENFGFVILQLNEIVETALMKRDELPQSIVGFTSTALINISKIYKDIDVISYRFPNDVFLNPWNGIAQEFYDNFKHRENLKVIDL